MKKNYRDSWRKLDNTAKIFSLSAADDMSVFRFSVVLKEKIKEDVLSRAVIRALNDYPEYRVKLGTGIFWNYLDFNDKAPIVSMENDIPCASINLRKNNDYLFKVTYFSNKINLDIYHVLTDGTGAIYFLRGIIYHYLELYHNLDYVEREKIDIDSIDQYLKYYDKKYSKSSDMKPAFIIPGKANMRMNNTYHYTVSIKDIKKVCKKLNVTITEYITAKYMYSLYLTYFKKTSKKELSISIPINLRKYYDDETLSNFFTYMNVKSNFKGKDSVSFDDVLDCVKNEFSNKLIDDKVKEYLARDMKLGMNLSIRLVPLFVKKLFISLLGKVVTNSATTRLSNIGIVEIDKKYKKYIDNIYVLVLPNKVQKIKCTICSYDDKLNITLNSNVNDVEFENIFLDELRKNIINVDIDSNNIINKKRKKAIICIR